MITRKKVILNFLESNPLNIHENTSNYGFSASQIGNSCGFDRSNSSRELNKLNKENQIIKIKEHPTKFASKKIMLGTIEVNLKKSIYKNTNEIIKELYPSTYTVEQSASIQQNFTTFENTKVFSNLIGYNGSLKKQVKQATASILYPPKGLHCLLIGESGVGKTRFAKEMYDFAIQSKKIKENAPYIVFNCADYANNSQLLISHLFGHVKGAFTGATEEKKGLVDYANNGILLLDEVHRLPSEGQEMLFSLMDDNKFRRLGESKVTRKANLLIICATTENENMLQTFLRRIPSVIELPSLEKRPLNERLELINFLFYKEAQNTQKAILISREILSFLLTYDCTANIGQLSSDIQLLCANAFVDSLDFSNITPKYSDLPQKYADTYEINTVHEQKLANILPEHITYFPNNPCFYSDLAKQDDEPKNLCHKLNLINVQQEVLLNDTSPLCKIISESDYHFLSHYLAKTLNAFNKTISSKKRARIILYVFNLIKQKKQDDISQEEKRKQHSHSLYYEVALNFLQPIEEKYQVTFSIQEIQLISTFLDTIKQEKDKVAVYIVTHGNSSASDMANTANTLLETDHAQAICMPLNASVQNTYEITKEKILKNQHEKGILLLVDMNSLTTFGDRIERETGIPTKTINMVSTSIVIEAINMALMCDQDLDSLYQNLLSHLEKEITLIPY